MAAYTCYIENQGFGYQQVGPPAELNWTITYQICDTTANQLQLCASSNDYSGFIAGSVACPATLAQVQAAAQAAVQAAEPAYTLLAFVWLQ